MKTNLFLESRPVKTMSFQPPITMVQRRKREKDPYLMTFQKPMKSILESIQKIPLGKVTTTMGDSSKLTIPRNLQFCMQ